MRKVFARLLTACALAAFAFCLAAADARAQAGEKRRDGPIAGPIIKLPPGQYEESLATPEDDARQQQQKPATTARGETRAPQRWEYCSIYWVASTQKGFGSGYTGVAYVRYYRRGGEQIEGSSEDDALANAMNKLGEDGWELVAIRETLEVSNGSGITRPVYFFKRPL